MFSLLSSPSSEIISCFELCCNFSSDNNFYWRICKFKLYYRLRLFKFFWYTLFFFWLWTYFRSERIAIAFCFYSSVICYGTSSFSNFFNTIGEQSFLFRIFWIPANWLHGIDKNLICWGLPVKSEDLLYLNSLIYLMTFDWPFILKSLEFFWVCF